MKLSEQSATCHTCRNRGSATEWTRLSDPSQGSSSLTTTSSVQKCSRTLTPRNMSRTCRAFARNCLSLALVVLLICSVLPSAFADNDKSDSEESHGVVENGADVKVEQQEGEIKLQPGRGPGDTAKLMSDDPYSKLIKDKGIVDLGFIHAFVASLSVIIVSELGDKTFFIAAIMAMRHPRLTVFAGAMMALGLMTILSAVLGYATTVIPRWFTYYASSALFAIFGIKMLREGYYMGPDEGQEEYEEVQADLRKKEEEAERDGRVPMDAETGIISSKQRNVLHSFFSRIFLQSFTLTFLAEWGDRSQISTIILAARDEVIGVIIGGTLGHALCTGLAVLGGRFIAQRISIRTVTLVGGVVFIIFALSALVIEPDD